jgi:PAS domain S-box-containing protein
LVYLPVHQRMGADLAGYVVGILDLERLLESFITDARRRDIVARITDVSPGAPAVVLEDGLPGGSEPDIRREIAFGGMVWRIDMTHVGKHRDASSLGAVHAYLAFAIFAALLVAFAVLGSAGRNAATNARVRERTAELAQALDRLNDREAEERAVLDNIVECVVTIDTDGTVLNINRAVEPMFGYAPEQVIGRNVSMLMPGPEATAHDGHLRRYLHTGERRIIGRNREVEGLHRDGHVIALELAVSEYVFGQRRVFTGTLRDIGERKSLVADLTRAREHADEANRAKSAFLAAMSHEIRTPMNGVVGLVDVLARSSLNEYQRDLVRTIRESSTTLLTLIDDILDFSKIEAGRLEIERRPLQLAELVEGVCSSLSPMAVRRGVDLSLHIDPELPADVISDEVRLRQVLFNIVGNAIKFSAGRPDVRGAVSVRVGFVPGVPLRVVFSVADNGIGIAPERLHDLFRPFTQAETSTTRRFGGTGLGLAICKRLVDMLDGRIDADSEIGAGSTFRVTLPLEAAQQTTPPAQPDLHGVECLISPCCGNDADTLQAYLAHAGAKVHRPADTAGAVRIAGEAPRPLVVIDCARNGRTTTGSLAPPGTDVRTVRVMRGRNTPQRSDSRNLVSIDGNVLRRSALLRAVAVAAGRASPDTVSTSGPDEADIGSLTPPEVSEARAQGRLILVAEDNEINQKVVLHQLALLGYAADVAEDGEQALRMWNAGSYGLLLTDLHMPQMDGYALTAAIRAAEPAGTRKPILALTANALRGEERRALDVGMDAYLTKPVQLDELRRTLERYLPGNKPVLHAPAAAPVPDPVAGPTPNEVDQPPVFDVSVLEELVGDDQEIVREFLDEFRRSAGELAEGMRNALAGGWATEAGNAAHKLKSAARSVGALALGELCATIERKAREDDCTTLSALLPAFDTLLHDTGERIGEFLEHR